MDGLSNLGKFIINDAAADEFTAATTVQPRRDPLTLDLDGDGLETTGIDTANPVYFDHDADGIKTSTGWVGANDGFLVLDKNGNGTIDNGRELFGDAYLKSNGQLASDGFDALSDLDSNADGVVDANDARFADLRVWRDLNQDGVSQGNELFSLSGLGIAAVNVQSTEHNQTLANGNQVADLGTFVKTDGSSGTLGEVSGNLGDVNLIQDTFHREFTDKLDTSSVSYLPDMQGSGAVRDLREAATLSPQLKQLLTDFTTADRSGQLELLPKIIKAWADTGTLLTTFNGYSPYATGPMYSGSGGGSAPPPTTYTGMYSASTQITVQGAGVVGSSDFKGWVNKLDILETFNGRTFRPVADDGTTVHVVLAPGALDLLNQAYSELSDSVYIALIAQTRLKPYLEKITLHIDENGIGLNFSAMNALFKSYIASEPSKVAGDLLELQKYFGKDFNPVGWDGAQLLIDLESDFPSDFDLIGLMTDLGFRIGTIENDLLIGLSAQDELHGGNGNDKLRGAAGDDILYGDDGDDELRGDDGDDTLIDTAGWNTLYGGAGNDSITGQGVLVGGTGDDVLTGSGGSYATWSGQTYQFNVGDGKDTLIEYGSNDAYFVANYGNKDVLQFGAGIHPADVARIRVGNDLVFKLNDADQVTVKDWFVSSDRYIEEIQFADGSKWTVATLQSLPTILNGGDGNDNLTGWAGVDTISGGLGNDSLKGGDGNDTLNGNDGDDTLNDTSGWNTFYGGAGNDSITGQGVLVGGTGDDVLTGSGGSYATWSGQTYQFNVGDGKDTLIEYGSNDAYFVANYGNKDVLQFGAGIHPADVARIRVGNDLVFKLNDADQVTVKDWFVSSDRYIEEIQFADGSKWTVATLQSLSTILNGGDGNDSLTGWVGVDTISGGLGNDSLKGGDGNDTLNGNDGDDTLNDTSGWNTFYGGAGNDSITGQGVLVGGTGDDVLTGSGGSYATWSGQTYQFNVGDGKDTLIEYGSNDAYFVANYGNKDVLQFGAGIHPADVARIRVGNDLVFKLNDADQVTVKDWFVSSDRYIEEIQFADGSKWTVATLQSLSTILNGGDGNDSLTGWAGVDTISGGLGNDSLKGGDGNDTLNGNDGDDTLNDTSGWNTFYGGAGNDSITGQGVLVGGTGDDVLTGSGGSYATWSGQTYQFNVGDGKDTLIEYGSNDAYFVANYGNKDVLQFGAGIHPADVARIRVGNDLVFKLNDADQVTVKDWFVSSDRYIEEIQFADGSKWTVATLQSLPTILNGGDGNDNLTGWAGVDTISGGLGNDSLKGGDGNDTLNGNDGDDTLNDTSGWNTFYGGAGNDSITGQGVLVGGTGDDVLTGSGGSYATWSGQTYQFNVGDGKDTLIEYGSNDAYFVANYGNKDVLQFGAGIHPADVARIRVGNDLVFKLNDADQVTVKDWFVSSDRYIEEIQFADGSKWTVATLQSLPTILNGGDGNDNLTGWAGVDTISGGLGNDSLKGGDGNDTLNGNDGDDTLNDTSGWNTFYGGAGNDSITGQGVLVGGTGDDVLTGSGGSYATWSGQTYQFNVGDGKDTLIEYGSNDAYFVANYGNKDVLQFGAGIHPADVARIRVGNDLVFKLNDADQVTVKDWFVSSDRYIEEIQFADGSKWTVATLQSLPTILNGGDGNDNLTGWAGVDTISGGLGNDSLKGGDGNDTLNGNDGDDTLNDTSGWNTFYGGAGNDSITGQGVLVGGTGDDVLTGSGGSYATWSGQTYQFNVGDGKDTLIEYGSNDAYFVANYGNKDVLQFGAGIHPADVARIRVGNDLVFKLNDADQVTVKDWFVSSDRYIEEIQFADGSKWSQATILSGILSQLSGTDVGEHVLGTSASESISGLAGDDFVSGMDGNDLIDGGLGNDQLMGGSGNDRIFGGLGDDTISGELGNDRLFGGGGSDIFQFSSFGSINADIIADFLPSNDIIELDHTLLSQLSTTGVLSDELFIKGDGVTASDENDFVLYDTATGTLYYDADGNGAEEAQEIVTLVGAPSITAADIVVV
ncbi:calcium-binding protein [Methylomonas rhizoryzae]|uniref:calcium-binding protein n=1 Tax=Methylomonas rhizoryzae TaxID=2608981 RepID=UPI0012324B17|nr:calcium-binding protein [Methylomonas rhizoryzae]